MAGSISFCSHRERRKRSGGDFCWDPIELDGGCVCHLVPEGTGPDAGDDARMTSWLGACPRIGTGKMMMRFWDTPCSDNPKQWWLVVLYTANIIYPIRSPWYPINSQFSKDHSSFWGIFSAYHRQLTLQVVTIYATLGPLDVRQEGISTNG